MADKENEVKFDQSGKAKDTKKNNRLSIGVDYPTRGEDYISRKYGVPTVPVPQPNILKYDTPAETFAAYFPDSPLLAQNQPGYGVPNMQEKMFRRAMADIGKTPYVSSPVEEVEDQSVTDWLAQAQALQSQFTPNYADIMARYSDEGQATNAAIQALYSKLAEGAQQNVQQIQDIYGGAESATGQAYDIGTGNVGEAYSSAQQQAADQLARLGIEAAAPQVIDPMALSQAETQSALESGRASALGGIASRGAAAQDFASQMAQAAQLRGAEYQTSVTDALRRQLIGLELQAQQDAYQRALQAPGLAQDLYAASQLGQPQGLSFEQQMELDRFAYQQALDAAEIQQQLTQGDKARYAELFTELGDPEKALQQLEYERANVR